MASSVRAYPVIFKIEFNALLSHFIQFNGINMKYNGIGRNRSRASKETMDSVLDAIGQLPGVAKTTSSIVLSTKLDR